MYELKGSCHCHEMKRDTLWALVIWIDKPGTCAVGGILQFRNGMEILSHRPCHFLVNYVNHHHYRWSKRRLSELLIVNGFWIIVANSHNWFLDFCFPLELSSWFISSIFWALHLYYLCMFISFWFLIAPDQHIRRLVIPCRWNVFSARSLFIWL